MTDYERIDQHVELLHTYHLDLWSEIEAQLRVLRTSQEQIAKLRADRVKAKPMTEALSNAELLAQHVQTLKARVRSLGTTVEELEATVGNLVNLLTRASAQQHQE